MRYQPRPVLAPNGHTEQGSPLEEWRPVDTAPLDGTPIQARIPGHGDDNIIAWQAGAFEDDDGRTCGGWAFVTDQEPPECWTDGVCWSSNEDGVPSVQPTHWKPALSGCEGNGTSQSQTVEAVPGMNSTNKADL